MITGYAAVYYNGTEPTQFRLGPGYVERFMPGAFERALASGSDVVGLFNHDMNLLLGRVSAGTMTLSADSRGLKYEISESGTSISKDVADHQQRGDLVGSSIGFRPTVERMTTDGPLDVRELHEVEIRDVGPVTYPAYDGTADVRCFDNAGHAMALPETAVAELRSMPLYRNHLAEVIAARLRAIHVDLYGQ